MSYVLVTVRTVRSGSSPTVQSETEVGDLTAHWRGDESPEVGSKQDGEVDVLGPLAWSDGARIVAPNGASEHDQSLTALVEDIEGEGVAVRIGDSVVLLEVGGMPPRGAVGGTVT